MPIEIRATPRGTQLRLRSIVAALSFAAMPLSIAPAWSQDAAKTRLLAANCANCHGTEGRAQGGMPTLAGLPKEYMVQQMKDFKSGKRVATIMHQLSKGYTDAEIDALAGWFAAQQR